MRIPDLTRWPTDFAEAKQIQQELAPLVIRHNRLSPNIRRVAGVDVGFEKQGTVTRAAVAVLDFPGLELRAQAVHREPTRFPYVPGYLSFREVPAVIAALAMLDTAPDLILCDGQGIAHPRRFGLACHLGVLVDVPTIGVAKSRLVGTHEEPGPDKGDRAELLHQGEIIGTVLRTRLNVRPLYISIGHRVDLATSVEYVLRCTTRYRLPETTRWAHRLASG